MDDRVYSVKVCDRCLTQTNAVESACGCENAGLTIVRFKVGRQQILMQANPRQSLIEKSRYFGCVGQSGHYYWQWPGTKEPRLVSDSTPWGMSIDGGLFPHHTRLKEGEAHVFHKEGWTALAFEDRSVDTRPGSWSVFCFPDVLDGVDALVLARQAWPKIFARYTFEVTLAST